eukprot:gene45684-61867_t
MAVSARLGRIPPVLLAVATLVLVLPQARPSRAGDEVLWPQQPVHIDRSRQHFERLPASQAPIDTRVWITVPDRIKILDSASFSIRDQVYRFAGIHPVALKRLC